MNIPEYEYLSPQQIVTCGKYPFTIAQMRHFLLYRHKNGLEKCIRKIGKRILFRKDLWQDWIERQQKQ